MPLVKIMNGENRLVYLTSSKEKLESLHPMCRKNFQ
jgi:hypothetical protein